jgi:phage terminase large subunit-like protein
MMVNFGLAHAAVQRSSRYRPGQPNGLGLRRFVEDFWPTVEPAAPYADGWHIDAVCEFLEAWYARDFANAVLNLPPGTGKSLIVDVFFDAWVWAYEPGHKFLTCSYDMDLGIRDADKVQSILASDRFLRTFLDCRLRRDMHARRNLWTTQGGYRFATSPEGKGLGRHFTSVSVNDPVKAQDVLDGRLADVNVALERAQRWFDGTLQTRRADPKRFGIMVTMQRLREKDLAEVCLERGYEHLCLPMRYEPRAHWIRGAWSERLDERGPGRKAEAEPLLHPARYPEDVVRSLESSLAEHASAQLQQNPIPRTGGLLEEPHLRWEWVSLPATGGYYIQTWDFAAKGTSATHSAVHGALWLAADITQVTELTNLIEDRERGSAPTRTPPRELARETRYALVDERWGIWSVPESEAIFESVQSDPAWAKSHQIVIEAKAAGIGIIQKFERRFPKVVAFHELNDECKRLAVLDKLDRHRTHIGEWHAGRVLLPPWKRTVPDRIDGKDGPGPDAFRKELLAFPRGARDDRVDTSSMALAVLTQGRSRYYDAISQLARQGRGGR